MTAFIQPKRYVELANNGRASEYYLNLVLLIALFVLPLIIIDQIF